MNHIIREESDPSIRPSVFNDANQFGAYMRMPSNTMGQGNWNPFPANGISNPTMLRQSNTGAESPRFAANRHMPQTRSRSMAKELQNIAARNLSNPGMFRYKNQVPDVPSFDGRSLRSGRMLSTPSTVRSKSKPNLNKS